MEQPIVKSFDLADEHRPFADKGELEVIRQGDITVARATFEPGWKWSQNVRPLAGTELCEVSHITCIVSGRLHVEMEDGQQLDLIPGEVAFIPPGHDAWVVGDQPCIALDFSPGMEAYARAGIPKATYPEQPTVH